MVKRIAVGQGGGPTPVINDTLAGIVYEAQLRGIEVIGLKNGVEGGGLNPDIDGNLIDLNPSVFNPNLIRGIPGAYLGTTRLKLDPKTDADKIAELRTNMNCKKVDALIYIGGNDTAATLQAEGKGIHVQKTIDTDLPGNDHTSGWISSTYANVRIIKALDQDFKGFAPRILGPNGTVFSTAPVVVYQNQGRNTGHLTIGNAFAKVDRGGEVDPDAAPHLFLTREMPYNENQLIDEVRKVINRLGYVFVVCSEEIADESGKTLAKLYGKEESQDESGHTEHGRANSFNYAAYIASRIKERLGTDTLTTSYRKIKETAIVPQHIPRSLERTLIDADEAFDSGREAVRAFDNGDINISIALERTNGKYTIQPTRIPIEIVAGKVKTVEPKYLGDIHGPTKQFYEDFLPALGGAKNLPHYKGPELVSFKG